MPTPSASRANQLAILRGVVPIIPTPFVAGTEEVDFGALESLIDFAVDAGAAAVCLPAYASEFYKLTEDERYQLVDRAVQCADGRVKVIAQSNHSSAKIAAEFARKNEELGADMISFAIPRLFDLPTDDILSYCGTICSAVNVSVLIQDFNPNGSTVGADFCRRLVKSHPNFRYIKLEEPLMGQKVLAIREATGDKVGVLEGWGGLYMLELFPTGICGIMPGLAIADVLVHVWNLAEDEQLDEAMDIFERVCPQLVFSLQNLELFLQIEKRLLTMRGLMTDSTVRSATFSPSDELLLYGEFVNRRVMEVANELESVRFDAET